MFNRIKGIFSGHAEEALHISTGAIEWEIFVPVRDPSFFAHTGEETELFTWLHHYQDGMRLYGFFTAVERQLFFDLQKVEGIGPRQAFKILQGIAPEPSPPCWTTATSLHSRRSPESAPRRRRK
jgi:Holliday junction resolvasome, DNA-binding subunit